MKERFREAKRVWRAKYGPCTKQNFAKDLSVEKVEDTISLFFKLGELHNEHHRQLADRKYQQEWRDSNREAVRTYQRNYARKRRGTSPEMYRLSEVTLTLTLVRRTFVRSTHLNTRKGGGSNRRPSFVSERRAYA